MTVLDCPMQTKAWNLFWHKTELKLLELPDPEAPVFTISRSSLFGGREEFPLQYPARLEPQTEKDLARFRFSVQHGKKRRSFQAPDTETMLAWRSALEKALAPPKEATANPTKSTSNKNGKVRINAKPPSSKVVKESTCYTRDPKKPKLIWLHRPAGALGTTKSIDSHDDIIQPDEVDTYDVMPEFNDARIEEEPTMNSAEPNAAAEDELEKVEPEEVKSVDVELDDIVEELVAITVASTTTTKNQVDEARTDVATVETKEVGEEVGKVVDELVAAVMALASTSTTEDDTVPQDAYEQENVELEMELEMELEVDSGESMSVKEDATTTAIAPATTDSARAVPAGDYLKWVPLDPNNSRLIWVRLPVQPREKSPARINSSKETIKPAHKWVPVDPSSTRLIWVRREAENAVTRIKSRYKATSISRKWVPLDPSSSSLIWLRRSVPIENVDASPSYSSSLDSASSGLYRHLNQRQHQWRHRH